MALIVYPDPNYDSFINVQDADDVIISYTVNSAEWVALSVDVKEAYLRIAFRHIIDNCDMIDGTNYDLCLPPAQALIAYNDFDNNISDGNASITGALKRQKVGQIEREFYDTAKTQKIVKIVPSLARPCLEKFNYTYQSSFLQTRLGRS